MGKDAPIVPIITSAILGAIWLFMTVHGPPPPAVLVQAIVASVGSISASQILKGGKDGKA